MVASEKELEEQLMDAGKRLLSPPSSVDELLPLLDEVELHLARVEQSPSQTMQDALSSSRKALVTKELLSHSDTDVKAAVAACISEITRITAPDAPYDDEQMKEIFQLIVSSFEKLDDKSSRSYLKRASILETVAKVRSCVVMLDLECDALILEMFQHFFKSVRDYHPENVVQSMETIMILVLEESEDIPLDLLLSILEYLKKDNKDVLPIAQRLGEKVLEKSAVKVKPYLVQAVKSSQIILDDYIKVVANVSQEVSDAQGPADASALTKDVVDEAVIPKASSDGAIKGDKQAPKEAESVEEVLAAIEKPSESIMSNGNIQKGVDDSMVVKESSKDLENDANTNFKGAGESSKNIPEDSELIVNKQPKQKGSRKRGQKGSSSKSSFDPSEVSVVKEEKKKEVPAFNESEKKEIGSPPHVNAVEDTTTISHNSEKGTDDRPCSPRASDNEAGDVASPSASGKPPDESRSEKVGDGKNTDNLSREAMLSVDKDLKKPSEAVDIVEAKSNQRLDRESSSKVNDEENACGLADPSKKEVGTSSDFDTKPTKLKGKKDEAGCEQQDVRKRRGRGKAVAGKDVVKTASKDVGKGSVTSPRTASKDVGKGSVTSPRTAMKSAKEESHVEKTSTVNSKRKRTSVIDKASESHGFGEDVVGSRVKVWWPMDKEYYEGYIASYDHSKRKHKVLYNDGDMEILNLSREKWLFVKDDDVSDEGDASGSESLEASLDIRKKKKTKTNPNSSTKPGKSSASSKKGRTGASSSKSKASASKTRRNKQTKQSDDDSDNDVESLDEDDKGGKSKDSIGGVGNKGAGKLKDDDMDTPKTGTRTKQERSKYSAKSRGQSPRSDGGKSKSSATNGTGKGKAGSLSLKGKETESLRKTPSESTKAGGESEKGRSRGSSNARKGGKKRRRGS